MAPKESRMPSVRPRGRHRPPSHDDENTTGSSGHTHGAAIVTRPERNAKRSSTAIYAGAYQTVLTTLLQTFRKQLEQAFVARDEAVSVEIEPRLVARRHAEVDVLV